MLDGLVAAGKLRHYGVSVETVDEALGVTRIPGRAERANHLQHVPSEAGRALLRRSRTPPRRHHRPRAARQRAAHRPNHARTTFAADDHRTFNRNGELFDVGETFSGVPLDAAFAAVDDLKPLVPSGATLTQFALRWTLMWDAVTCAIPGARSVAQAVENAGAADLPAIPDETMAAVERIYDIHVHQHVHAKW